MDQAQCVNGWPGPRALFLLCWLAVQLSYGVDLLETKSNVGLFRERKSAVGVDRVAVIG